MLSAGLWLTLVGGGCAQPRVGASASSPARIAITGAAVNASRRVVVIYTVTRGEQGVPAAVASTLQPSWTLAGLGTDPVSHLPAWKSYLLLGGEVLAELPIAGPGTPPELVAKGARQPWFEDGGAVQELGLGKFSYTFATALPEGFDSAETLRVGVWLRGVVPGTADTTSTFDFVPGGGPLRPRELVLDQNCNRCHGLRQGHNHSRTGWKICVTCHTMQHADADTVDPAAMAGATPETNPNPLEFGRLIHRVHRGRLLPTLYLSSSTAPAPPVPPAAGVTLPLPFASSRNKPLLGQKFSVVDEQNGAGEMIFGQVVSRTDNGQPAVTHPTGLVYLPTGQDYRNCDACHAGAGQQGEVVTAIARRTCQGCHPDVWYGDGAPTDQVHLAHPGGPQPDDSRCPSCHVAAGAMVPHAEAHQAPFKSPYYDTLSVKLVAVSGMVPGGLPTITFSASDLNGPLAPSLTAPVPASDAGRDGKQSPVPRALNSVSFTLVGPSTEYLRTSPAVSDSTSGTARPAVPDPVVAGQYSYTFTKPLPAGASGTWTVIVAARRSAATKVYDATGRFTWPYTGETLGETTDNDVQYVDLAAGVWPGGNPVPRRRAVDTAKCNVCHLRLQMHQNRNEVQYCVTCHTPDYTDWASRPKGADGNVNLSTVTASATTGLPVAATYDGIEERSLHLKVMQHRLHTGYRTGSASLGLARPYVIAFGGPYFFDDVTMPNMIRNCALCHVGDAFEIENIDGTRAATVANENPDLQHQGTSAHTPLEPHTPPITAACMGCHDTQAALTHSKQYTTLGNVEQCLPCHGRAGISPVADVHGVVLP